MEHREGVLNEFQSPAPSLNLDRLLRFDAWVSELYERERGKDRTSMLRRLICAGLVLYNAYNFTSLFLLPDILWIAIGCRIVLITPASFLVAWSLEHVSPKAREWLATGGMVNAFAFPAFLFWLSDAPLSGYVFAELTLTLVYGNMLLLRFQQAIVFTISAFVIATAFALTKVGLPDGLRAAFLLQVVTACAWTLYANYQSEAVRCRAYLEELGAKLRSEASEAASNRFLDLSFKDALTTLPNRRSLDETVARWSREQAGLAIMMIDVDHFKLFNDTLGHPAGDQCLCLIASALSSATTGTEHFVARFGGEEFTVVARNLDTLRAARLARTIVEAVEALGIAHPGRSDGSGIVTVSAGIALKPTDMDPKTAFELADAALYEAKRRGRNRYVLADSAVDCPVQHTTASVSSGKAQGFVDEETNALTGVEIPHRSTAAS